MERGSRADGFVLGRIFLFWLGIQVGLILFAGESLGGDAWAYAKAAEIFHATGRLVIPDRSPQSLIFLTLWSGLFTNLFGFSFLVLNFASLALNAIGAVFFALLLKEVRGDSSIAIPLAVYLFNPLFFLLAGSYLTDVPFLSLIVIAIYFFTRAYRRGSVVWALVGSMVAASAFLIRQYAILLPVAAVVPLLWRDIGLPKSKTLAMIAAVVLPSTTTAILFFLWLTYRHGIPSDFNVYKLEFLNLPRILWSVLAIPFFASIYLGVFLSPLLPGRTFCILSTEKKLWSLYGLLLVGVTIILAVRSSPLPFGWNNVMPYLRNSFTPPAGSAFWIVITAWGVVGATTLLATLTASASSWVRACASSWDSAKRSHYLAILRAGAGLSLMALLLVASGLLRHPLIELGEWTVTQIYHRFGGASGRHTFTLSYWIEQVPILYEQTIWALSLILVIISSGLLYGYLTLKRVPGGAKSSQVSSHTTGDRSYQVMLASFLLISLAFLVLFYTDKDRYLLILLPPAILLLHTRPESQRAKLLSLLLVILLAAIAIGSAFVGVQVSRNIWAGGRYLLDRGIAPERIRADISFNAWTLYDRRGKRRPDDPPNWWVIGDDYVVDTRPWPGYIVIKELPYWNCFRFVRESVYVMTRSEPK
ncbi:MAG TPA: glycosyltransferase family 39 protein [Blastocatellia bacterium]|nr:glycosyltransferase family 39 protein [Blastocatellia bacterium]